VTDAFDADALIYAAVPGHPLGSRVLALFSPGPVSPDDRPAGVGSVLLLPEVLSKPVREEAHQEIAALAWFLSRLDLRPLDIATAELAVVLAASYRLRAADAVHLATAVQVGADRFVTNNRNDFPAGITEIEVTYLRDLPAAE
jgi:predicted nucleic acid-binding protein